MSEKFELIEKYKGQEDLLLPKRKTEGSAGHDFTVAEDTVVPAYDGMMAAITHNIGLFDFSKNYTLEEIADIVKKAGAKVTLVPTGVKCKLDKNTFLQLSVRSSCPLNHWLVMGNGVGIIDADYYNNPKNEGHIYFQIINLSPVNIQLKKGDVIGQGIILPYLITEDDNASGKRVGGFGSTNNSNNK